MQTQNAYKQVNNLRGSGMAVPQGAPLSSMQLYNAVYFYRKLVLMSQILTLTCHGGVPGHASVEHAAIYIVVHCRDAALLAAGPAGKRSAGCPNACHLRDSTKRRHQDELLLCAVFMRQQHLPGAPQENCRQVFARSSPARMAINHHSASLSRKACGWQSGQHQGSSMLIRLSLCILWAVFAGVIGARSHDESS